MARYQIWVANLVWKIQGHPASKTAKLSSSYIDSTERKLAEVDHGEFPRITDGKVYVIIDPESSTSEEIENQLQELLSDGELTEADSAYLDRVLGGGEWQVKDSQIVSVDPDEDLLSRF